MMSSAGDILGPELNGLKLEALPRGGPLRNWERFPLKCQRIPLATPEDSVKSRLVVQPFVAQRSMSASGLQRFEKYGASPSRSTSRTWMASCPRRRKASAKAKCTSSSISSLISEGIRRVALRPFWLASSSSLDHCCG